LSVLSISKPLSVAAAEDYYDAQYSNGRENYYAEEENVTGLYFGELAEEMGLSGDVGREEFQRLIRGQNPHTGEQIIKHVPSKTYNNKFGKQITTATHRAGWDLTFNAPKSISLAAGPGGDKRIPAAVMEAARETLQAIEPYVMAKSGNDPASVTGKMIACLFQHDSARPDRTAKYAAPHQHIHAFVSNMTMLPDGTFRALETSELFKSQRYATSLWWTKLVEKLSALGYEFEMNLRTGAPEIKGFSQEYLEASSTRRREILEREQEIKQRLEAEGHTVKEGAGLRQAAAKMDRQGKKYDQEEMRARHLDLDALHDDQARNVVEQALLRGPRKWSAEEVRKRAQEAVTFARDHAMEREAVTDNRQIMTQALRRNMTLTTLDALNAEIEGREAAGEFVVIERGRWREMTTQRMLDLEQENIRTALEGKGTQEQIVDRADLGATIDSIEARQGKTLNESQRRAVEEILTSRDQILGLQGRAGTGKTTTLSVLKDALQERGYFVHGLAPLTRAAKLLEESGIHTTTLQKFLCARDEVGQTARYFVLDESSLTDTVNMREFFDRLGSTDRVLLVGDDRQHQAINAGAPFEQLIKAGMEKSTLDQIVRQKDPGLRQVVEKLAAGQTKDAVAMLISQGRVTEVENDLDRLKAVANDYCSGGNPIVICPRNVERSATNTLIHLKLQYSGAISREDHHTAIYVNRDITGAERTFAAAYQLDDIVRYSKGNKRIKAGEYWRVVDRDYEGNLLTVQSEDGREETYNPKRLKGVSVYREDSRLFAQGDRIQFRAPLHEKQVATNELGTIKRIEENHWTVKLDSGREIDLDIESYRHIDHGYAVTSISSQGQTAYRGIINADTNESALLLNKRTAYVASSRAMHDAHIYTNSIAELPEAFDRNQDNEIAQDALKQARDYQSNEASQQQRQIEPDRERIIPRGSEYGVSM
jgi:conjugative relaxase-like TrwC/TraI family protein